MAANATSLLKLSASTQGQAIKIVATATPGTLLHTTLGDTTTDEIYIWAFNSDTVVRTLTVEMGGATAPDQNIVQDIPSKAGRWVVVDGEILTGSPALTVKAFASAANVVTCTGKVYRITP